MCVVRRMRNQTDKKTENYMETGFEGFLSQELVAQTTGRLDRQSNHLLDPSKILSAIRSEEPYSPKP